MSSDDARIIAEKAAYIRKLNAISDRLPKLRLQTEDDLELLFSGLVGDRAARFRALRVLVKRFGLEDAYLLTLIAAEKSNQKLRIILRERKNSELPDNGRQKNMRDRQMRNDRIGLTYFRFRRSGLSDEMSLSATRDHLALTLGESSIKSEVKRFARSAKARGYVDPNDPGLIARYPQMSVRKPEFLISEISRKGRPKKMGINDDPRIDLFPPMKKP